MVSVLNSLCFLQTDWKSEEFSSNSVILRHLHLENHFKILDQVNDPKDPFAILRNFLRILCISVS